ncbi:hypothetical protein HD554DRAFT_2118344 [Boletus coccyginus]|nr:hypothetical protein HD554DRAFT_2118344 [Boletus coccyginus]
MNPQSLIQDEWVKKTLGLAGYTCLVYDHTLTFDKEVEFIWGGSWTFTKTFFLFNRYGNLICQTIIQIVIHSGWLVNESAECYGKFNVFTSAFMNSSEESVHILVLLRAWALWGCQRRVAAVLICSYLACLLVRLVGVFFGMKSLEYGSFQYTNLPRICVTILPAKVWILPILTACQDTIAFGTTMSSLWSHSRGTGQHLYPSALIHLLVRDAVVFYVVCILFNVFNLVMWSVYASSPKNVLSLTFALNLLSIAGQRLVLNLRGIKGRSYGPRSISAEVDRQLEIIGNAHPEWWNSDRSQSVRSEKEQDEEIEMEAWDQRLHV